MRDRCRTERALPVAANAQNGAVGVHCVREISAQIAVHQEAALQRGDHQVHLFHLFFLGSEHMDNNIVNISNILGILKKKQNIL